MAVYIAGPITGDPDAEKKFAAAETWLKEDYDYTVMNPIKIFQPISESITYEALIKTCCAIASECEIIALLQGWEKSFGACMELLSYLHAHKNNRLIIYPTDHYWAEIFDFDKRELRALEHVCRKRIKKGR